MVSPPSPLAASSAFAQPSDGGSGEVLSGEAVLGWRRRLLELGGHSSDLDWLLDLAGGLRWSSLQRLRLEPGTSVRLMRSRQELEAIWCRHRRTSEPLQYLVGVCPWRDLELRVAPGVLIPRQETEILVDLALASLSADRRTIQLAAGPADGVIGAGGRAAAWGPGGGNPHGGATSGGGHLGTSARDPRAGTPAPDGEAGAAAPAGHDAGASADDQESPGLLWADLGTGSGCVALALARALPGARGLAVDRSEQALAQAAHNLTRYGLEKRVNLRQGDWWRGLEPWWGQIDLVVANPPYIPSALIPGLDSVVRDHEPGLALDGGIDGLEAIRAIAAGARRALAPGGVLLLEHHHDQSPAVLELLAQVGLEAVSAHPDLQGTLRFARAHRSRQHG
ncbi:MAG: HemK/PrmC family methyltransferase [Cyanobium sp.]